MGADTGTEPETEQVAVRTYVPRYQKEEWAEHADELDMSLSEFVRSMTNAGRRGFDETTEVVRDTSESPANPGSSPGNTRERLLETLAEAEYLTWDELREEVVGGIEADLEGELQSLMAENRVVHSPRNGGYRLVE